MPHTTETVKVCMFLTPQAARALRVMAATAGARGISEIVEQLILAAQQPSVTGSGAPATAPPGTPT